MAIAHGLATTATTAAPSSMRSEHPADTYETQAIDSQPSAKTPALINA